MHIILFVFLVKDIASYRLTITSQAIRSAISSTVVVPHSHSPNRSISSLIICTLKSDRMVSKLANTAYSKKFINPGLGGIY